MTDSTVHAHVSYDYGSDHLDYLRGQLDPAVTVSMGDDVPAHTTVFIGGRPSRELLESLSGLRIVMIPYVGVPPATRELLMEPAFSHISVHNSHHHAPIVAEMAVGLLLAAARRLIPVHNTFQTGDWRPRYNGGAPSFILDGKTALVLGYGEIGIRVADILRALGMRVQAIKRRVPPDSPDFLHPPDRLHDLLRETHALMICLPGTPETEGMIGADELALMPPGGIVVNIGRGPIIDQHALYDALQSGHLFGAGLDVWWHYPESEEERAHTLPADAPLHQLDNLVMSPHRSGAGITDEATRRRMDAIAAKLNAFARTGIMPDKVDLDAGY